jgi:hypothetical protein
MIPAATNAEIPIAVERKSSDKIVSVSSGEKIAET